MALFTGVQYNIYFNVDAALIYHLLPNVWKASYIISASIFVNVPYRPPYSTDKFISCVLPGLSQWFFHFEGEIAIAWTHIEWARWMFHKLPLPAAQEVRDSSGATTCTVMKNDGFFTTKYRRFLLRPCDYDLFTKVKEPLRWTRDNTRDELIRAIERSILDINKDGRADDIRRLPNIWQNVINKGVTILKVHKCCTPVNKAMSEISNCWHYVLSNLCVS